MVRVNLAEDDGGAGTKPETEGERRTREMEELLAPPPAAGASDATNVRKRDVVQHCLRVEELPIEAIILGDDVRDTPEVGIDELARDIRANGLINPITVDTDNKLVAGRRRFRALQLLKVKTVAVVRVPKDADEMLVEIAENLCRRDLTVQETARLFKAWLGKTGKKQTDLAKMLGVKPSRVSETLAILDTVEGRAGPQKVEPAPTKTEAVKQARASRRKKREEEASDSGTEAAHPGRKPKPREAIMSDLLTEDITSAVVEPECVTLKVRLAFEGKLTGAKLKDAFDKALRGFVKHLKGAHQNVMQD